MKGKEEWIFNLIKIKPTFLLDWSVFATLHTTPKFQGLKTFIFVLLVGLCGSALA
jgi:hypothetical protein